MTVEAFRESALSFDEAIEAPHFHLTSFRVGKKIFATLDTEKGLAMIPLSPVEQSLFVNGASVVPVPGGWGAKGATHFGLDRVDGQTVRHALVLAFCRIAPKRLADRYRDSLL